MALVQEKIGDLWHTYSDAGMLIHGGVPEADYEEAYDGEQREYVETNVPIEPEEDDGSNYYEEAGKILLGEEVE